MGAVTLAKLGDDTTEIVPGSGTNTVPVRFVGGMPVRRTEGPLILVAGMYVNLPESVKIPGPRRVRAVAVSIERDGFRDRECTVPSYIGTVHTVSDGEFMTGPRGSMEAVRLAWLRLAVESGTLCRVARMS